MKDVFFAEVPFALRAVDRAILGRLDKLENELSFALRTLEDFRQHVINLCCDCATVIAEFTP